MQKKILPIAIGAVLALSSICVYLFIDLRKERRRAAVSSMEAADLASRLAASGAALEKMTRQLEELERRARESSRPPEALRPENAAAAAAEAAAQPASDDPASALFARARPASLSSPDEAESRLMELLEKGDLHGMWIIVADLLSKGDAGYEKLIDLFEAFNESEQAKALEKSLQDMMRQEEIFIGPFLRDVSEHDEEILRFGLYLRSKEEEQLPKPMQELYREIGGKLWPVMLGHYRGNDAELLHGYVELYRGLLPEKLGQGNHQDAMISGLAQIPTDESTDLLIDLLGRSQGELQAHVARAIGWQGNPRSIPALEQKLGSVQEPAIREAIEAALRLLR